MEPFPIQAATIPDLLAGRDVCGRAPTGSGKTLAFGVAVAARVKDAAPRRPTALVLVPTRELATQVRQELSLLVSRRVGVVAIFGGVGYEAQRRALAKGVGVVVACPGRLEDLLQNRDLSLDKVQLVVLDEADRMADMGFLPSVRRILDQVSADRQTMLFSATLDGDVDALVKRYQRDPVRHEVPTDPTDGERVLHVKQPTARNDKVGATAELIRTHGPTIVFCRTRRGADRVALQLRGLGVRVAAMHGSRSQSQREQALASFAAGRVDALVATDVAARGIHVDGVGCVVHFDPPEDAKAYTHRSGRTGRAGAAGVVVSLDLPAAAAGPPRPAAAGRPNPASRNRRRRDTRSSMARVR